MDVHLGCKHRSQIYDEAQGALWCARCGGWIIFEEDYMTKEQDRKNWMEDE